MSTTRTQRRPRVAPDYAIVRGERWKFGFQAAYLDGSSPAFGPDVTLDAAVYPRRDSRRHLAATAGWIEAREGKLSVAIEAAETARLRPGRRCFVCVHATQGGLTSPLMIHPIPVKDPG